jgi:hypothetical protein
LNIDEWQIGALHGARDAGLIGDLSKSRPRHSRGALTHGADIAELTAVQQGIVMKFGT